MATNRINFSLTFNEIVKDEQKIREYRGDKSYALSSFFREVDAILALLDTAPDASNYLFTRIIINKIQGEALDVVRTIGENPSWENIKNLLISNYGINFTRRHLR